MADVVETNRDREVIVDREREPRSSAGWIIAAIVLIVVLLLLFGGSLFKGATNNGNSGTGTTGGVNTQLDSGTGTTGQ